MGAHMCFNGEICKNTFLNYHQMSTLSVYMGTIAALERITIMFLDINFKYMVSSTLIWFYSEMMIMNKYRHLSRKCCAHFVASR